MGHKSGFVNPVFHTCMILVFGHHYCGYSHAYCIVGASLSEPHINGICVCDLFICIITE